MTSIKRIGAKNKNIRFIRKNSNIKPFEFMKEKKCDVQIGEDVHYIPHPRLKILRRLRKNINIKNMTPLEFKLGFNKIKYMGGKPDITNILSIGGNAVKEIYYKRIS